MAISTVLSEDGTYSIISGTKSADSIYVAEDNVSVNAYGGDDTISMAGGDAISVVGGAGADVIAIDSLGYGDYIYDSDEDSISETLVGNYVDGGAGADSIVIKNNAGVVEGGDGDDVIEIGTNGSLVSVESFVDEDGEAYEQPVFSGDAYGGSGNDTITAETNLWLLAGGDGNDYISVIANGGEQEAYLEGGDGDNTIVASVNNGELTTGDGNDSIVVYENNCNINLQGGSDTIAVTINDAHIGSSADGNMLLTVETNTENANIYGATGADSIYVSVNNGEISGGYAEDEADNYDTGADYIEVGVNNGDIYGASGNDTVVINEKQNGYVNGGDGTGVLVYKGTDDFTTDMTVDVEVYDFTASTNTALTVTVTSSVEKATLLGSGDEIAVIDSDFRGEVTLSGFAGISADSDYAIEKLSNGDSVVTFDGTLLPEIESLGSDDLKGINTAWDSSWEDDADELYVYYERFDDAILLTTEDQSGTNVQYIGTVDTDNVITIDESSGIKSIVAGSLKDNLNISASNIDYMATGSGDDTISLYNSNSGTIDGGSGADEFEVTGDSNTILGGLGNDDIYAYGDYNSVDGGAGSEHAFTNGDYNTLMGGDGKDFLEFFGNYSSIVGGAGNDSLIHDVGVGNTLMGGTGNDILEIGIYEDEFGVDGTTDTVVVALGQGDGADSVTWGFKAGWNRSSDDYVIMYDEENLSADSVSGTINSLATTFQYGDTSLTVLDATNDATHFQIGNSDMSKIYNVSVIKQSATESVGAFTDSADNVLGDMYYGTNSGLNASALDSVYLDMTNNDYFGNGIFFGGSITTVIGGTLTTQIWGDGDYNQSLVATDGNTSLFGGYGAANDTLVGSTFENARNTYFWGVNAGNDVIENGYWYTETPDIIELGNTVSSIASYYSGADSITVITTTEGNTLTITEADENKAIAYGDSGNGTIAGYAKVGSKTGSTFTYEDAITDYLGHADVIDTLQVGSNIQTQFVIDGRNKTYKDQVGYYGNDATDYSYIDVYDASLSSANASIAGGDLNETIIGSKGANTLAGFGGNDYIDITNSASATIYLGESDGNDTINGVGASDKVVIYGTGITSDNVLASAAVDGNTLNITFSNGQTLAVNSADGTNYGTFQLEEEGSTWQYTNGGFTKTN